MRTLEEGSTCRFVAPGEAVVEASSSWVALRLCSVLFGDTAGQLLNYFFQSSAGLGEWRQKLRRDYPLPGDSACAFRKEAGEARECLILMRPEAETDRFTVFAPWKDRIWISEALRSLFP